MSSYEKRTGLLLRQPIGWQEYLSLAAIIVVGVLLRLHYLEGTSLSNDELSALYRLRFHNLTDLINLGIKHDGHPAGVQLFLYGWTRIFGDGVMALRLPFAFMGILCIGTAFAWSRLWFGNKTALFVASSVALLQFPVFYSQLARPYAPGLLMSMAMLWTWTELVFGDPQKNYRLKFSAFVLTAVLCCYIHYFAGLFALILGITGILELTGKERLRYLLAGLLIFLLYIPHFSILSAQMKIGGLGWLGPPKPRFLTDYIFNIFNQSWLLLCLSLGIGIVFFLLNRLSAKPTNSQSPALTHFHFLAIGLFFAPFLIGYIKSHFGKPVLQDSGLLFSFPLLPAFIFSFADIRSRLLFYILILLFCTASVCSLVYEKKYYTTEHYGQFRPLAKQIMEWDKRFGEQNTAHLINLNHPYYLDYYFNKWDIKKKFDLYRCDDAPGVDTLFQVVKNSSKPYLIYGWSNVGNPKIVEDIIHLRYRTLEARPHFNSGITLYQLERSWPNPTELFGSRDTAGFLAAFKPEWSKALLNISMNLKVPVNAHNPLPTRDREDDKSSGPSLIAAIKNKSGYKFWMGTDLCDYFPSPVSERSLSWQVRLPEIKAEAGDSLQIYIWDPRNIPYKATNFAVEVYQ